MSSSQSTTTKPQTHVGALTHDAQSIPNRRPMKSAAAKPQKSAGAFRTISEVAGELKVEQHVLRFWETKFSQIKPLKRGGGRRYYRPEDVELLKSIHHHLYSEGYTIKGVQKLLSANRGSLPAAGEQVEAEVFEETSPIQQAVSKNKDELASMLADLKSMRKLIG